MATHNRRAILAGLAVAAVAAAPIATSAVADTSDPIRPMLRRKLKRAADLAVALAAFEDNVVEPIQDQVAAAKAAVPHVVWETPDDLSASGEPMVYSTASKTVVKIARDAVSKPYDDHSFQTNLIKLAAAADARDAEIAAIVERSGLSALVDRSDRMLALSADAEWAFLQTPVVNVHELLFKLQVADRLDAFEGMGGIVMSDVTVLAGQVRA